MSSCPGSWRSRATSSCDRCVSGASSSPRAHVASTSTRRLPPLKYKLQPARRSSPPFLTAPTDDSGQDGSAFPTRSRPRWILPRGPREVALVRAVDLPAHHAESSAGMGGCERTCFHRAPAFRTEGGALPRHRCAARCAAYMPPRSTISVLRANHHGRFVASIIGPDGHVHGVAKVATDGAGREALDTEADNIRRFGDLLDGPLEAPKILAQEPGLLLLEPVSWLPRDRPSMLPPSVAQSLGQMFARRSNRTGKGIAHGDCAPWNLLRTGDGWVLVDWEEAWARSTSLL